MGRAAYIRKRLLLMLVVLFGVTVVIFSVIHLVPGDPAFLILGDRATEAKAAELRHQLGLDKPLLVQYWDFVSGIARGDFGMSLLYRQPVNQLVFRRIPTSLFLASYAMVLTAILTLPMGIWAAVRKDKPTDHLIRAGFLFTLTTPSFWLGILLILLFSLRLRLFPVAGFGEGFTGHLWYLFLPAFTLALQLSAVLIRNLRSQIISAMYSDYVRTARAKGLTIIHTVAGNATAADILPEVAPKDGEQLLTGTNPDKFQKTDLEKILKDKGFTTAIMVLAID